ncbi:hypothetical protein [Duganella sp. LjRoot269]|uniref:hypothetical protein n=1 Tax=Duganella sp. LjRoot269 TaxID=3342305 RepID=UPI003ECE4A2B
MKPIREALAASFPWLDAAEIEQVCRRLQVDENGSAIERMRVTADTLDILGLPPTSSLLLAIVGRGSKGAAVQVARETARSRFERASRAPGPSAPGATQIDATSIRAMLLEAVTQLRAPSSIPAAESEIVQMLRSVSGDVNWLKSTIDTERQLRKHMEQHGAVVEESHKQPDRVQERRAIVSDLARSLEANRFGSHYRAPDPADGAQE